MQKRLNSRGFTVVEVLLIVIIIGLVAGVGWWVYSQQVNQTQPDTSQRNEESKQTEIKTYDDDVANFRYPSTWTVQRDDNPNLEGIKQILITGPLDLLPLEIDDKTQLQIRIVGLQASSMPAQNPVFAAVALHNEHAPNTFVIFTEGVYGASDRDGRANAIKVVTGEGIATGNATTLSGAVVSGVDASIIVEIKQGDSLLQDVNFTDIEAMQQTQSFKDMVTILNSLQLKN